MDGQMDGWIDECFMPITLFILTIVFSDKYYYYLQGLKRKLTSKIVKKII